jgi:hypothetical protein
MGLCGMQVLSLILHCSESPGPVEMRLRRGAVNAGILTSHLRFDSGSRLLNRPQRERLPFLKARISAINKIQPAFVTGAQERFFSPNIRVLNDPLSIAFCPDFSDLQ